MLSRLLVISLPPHIHARRTVGGAMWRVVVALIPALICGLWAFGVGAAAVTATAVISCVLTEYAIERWMLGRRPDIANGAAALTGLLLAFNLPSCLPLWMVVAGSLVAIGVGKMSFGGLGCNIFNPALVGRVFLLISFPAQMTVWPLPVESRGQWLDAVTGATPLSVAKEGGAMAVDYAREMIGLTGGSLGEVSAAAILLGLIYLLATRVITWHIPLSILATVALFSLCVGADPLFQLLSGGLLLGAVFMATDYVTSPMTHAGMIVYGVMIGLITVIIRLWGSYPEGMSFAILIMNGVTPLINRYIKPKRFGERRQS